MDHDEGFGRNHESQYCTLKQLENARVTPLRSTAAFSF